MFKLNMSAIGGSVIGLAASTFLFAAPSFAQEGDAAAGESVFRKCASCHNVGPDAKNKVGPVLTGVVGRTAGTYEDYRYGDDLVAAGAAGLVWNEEEMFAYLEDPRDYLRTKLDDKKARSKMAFKLRDEQERRDVIAYLATFSEKPAE